MAFTLNFSKIDLLIIVVSVLAIIIARMKWFQQYWKRKGLPYLEPSFPYGNTGKPFGRKLHLSYLMKDFYNQLKQMNAKHGGIYILTSPVYMPVHPDRVKNVLQKDFQHFQDRGFYYNEKDEPIGAHLFAISGTKWRNLRSKLTPAFTSGKMKIMIDTLVQCATNMHEAMNKYENCTKGVDIKDMLARYTTDVIGSCAFGLECNSFKNENAAFRKYGIEIFKPIHACIMIIYELAFTNPGIGRKLGVKLFSKEVSEFFTNVIKDTIKYRDENNVKRNDMLQILLDLKSDGSADKLQTRALTLNEIAAQAFVFFVAGFETSSTTMAFCLYELAVNPEIQRKVRDEINSVLGKHAGKITYEAIADMKYMGQVIDETLRKYPPLAFLTRTCVEDYHLPDSDIIIEKGTRTMISTLGLHYDPEYFPNPDKFDPERFSEVNKRNIAPFTYLPFGEGPRNCIGLRFGLMQTKVGLTVLLRNYTISLNQKTVTPFNMETHSFVLTAREGIWLDIARVVTSH